MNAARWAAGPVGALAARAFGAWTRRVDASTLRADATAGVLGALLVLPQAFAFATLAGLPPQYGLATAIVPCIVAALFGSSWHVVSGPTNANSLALFATLAPLAVVGSPDYIALALAVTVLVGIIRDDRPIAPSRDDAVEAHDEMLFITTPDSEDALEQMLSPGLRLPRGDE